MAQVREKILRALEQYCKNQDSPDSQAQKPSLMARDDFNLNSLSFGQNAAWLFNDALKWDDLGSARAPKRLSLWQLPARMAGETAKL